MKLDRNINTDGKGKYALVNLRVLRAFLEKNSTGEHAKAPNANEEAVTASMKFLTDAGIITFGDENPGEQFFVMKYKDKFTAPALAAYSEAVLDYAVSESLREYGREIRKQAEIAKQVGSRIPD